MKTKCPECIGTGYVLDHHEACEATDGYAECFYSCPTKYVCNHCMGNGRLKEIKRPVRRDNDR